MDFSWILCWFSLSSFLCIHVTCTLRGLSTTSISDAIVLYEGVLTYDNTAEDLANDKVLVFPFVDGCDEAFCAQFNAYVLTSLSKLTTVLYNSCICKCKNGVLFDVKLTRCFDSLSNNTIKEISNMEDINNSSEANSTAYDLEDFEEDGLLEFHIWLICLSASLVLCIIFVYSAFEKRKQKRKQGKEQHFILQSKHYAHEVAGVRRTLMECYNMPRIKARPEDVPKCDNEFPERSRLSSDEDFIDSLSGSRESFLHPKWESRAPSIKVTIAETTLERLNENDEEDISDHDSFGKWTPSYTQHIHSKRKAPPSRKVSSSEIKTSALGKRFNSVGRRICTSSAFLNLYRQKRNTTSAAAAEGPSSADPTINAIATKVDETAATSVEQTCTDPSSSIETAVDFNGQTDETGVIEHDVILNV
ncbi:uncharacterized protein [Antedon mediterranea]|uniref:uncharacterized protein n=1 Tax=Antedon mediterranea TaxID=105859 RepID=UPI003AF573C7